MSGLLQSGAAADPIVPGAIVRPATIGEVWDANRVLARGDRTDAEAERLRREYEPLLSAVNADRAKRGLKPMVNPGYWQSSMERRPSADRGPFDFSSLFDTRIDRDSQENAIFGEIASIRRRDPGFLKDAPADLATFRKGVIDREKAARASARDVLGRSSGFTQGAVGFAAGTWETMHDPVNIASLPLGGGGGTIWAQAARSALVNGGLELLQQPIVAENRADLGEELTLGEAGLNTLMGAAGGIVGDVVIPQLGKAAIKGVGKAVDVLTPMDRKIASALARADLDGVSDADIAGMFGRHVPGDIRTPDESAAIHVIEREGEIRASSPYVDTPEGLDAHAARMQATMEALVRTNTAEAAPVAAAGSTARPKLRVAGGRLANDVVRFFLDKGYSEAQARGIAAGVAAEAASNHGAINPDSGALGLGQWLGTRKAELIRRYGPNPTRQQQLEFLHWELQGGDHGGKAVLRATDEASVLSAYVNDFMRPAKGAETTGDLSRGMAALGREGEDIAGAVDGGADIDAPIERPAAIDAERASIDAPEIDYADVPQLRRDLFGDDASWTAAQRDLVDAAFGRDIGIANDIGEVTAGWEAHLGELMDIAAQSRKAGRTALFHGTSGPWQPANTNGMGLTFWAEDVFAAARYAGASGGRRPGSGVGRLLARELPEGAKILDLTTPEGLKTLAALPVEGRLSGIIIRDARKDLEDLSRGLRADRANHSIWSNTKVAAGSDAAGIKSAIVDPLRRAGFDGLRFNDDSHATVALFDSAARSTPDNMTDPVVRDQLASARIDGAPVMSLDAPRQLSLFAEPHGEGAKLQADSLAHDMRAAIDADAAGADLSFRLDDGTETKLSDVLADLDEDEAMLATIRGCL